ncbi:unnamed protein product, partial [Brenthis ino]
MYKHLLDTFYRNDNSVKLLGHIGISLNTIAEAIINTIMMCSATFLAEMVLNEYDEVKEMLGDLLIMNKDEDIRKMIYECLEYIETRPPRYSIWRIFSLDIQLFIGFIQLCSTYVIIVLQFQY